jgi:hypothetical protein
VRFVRVTRFSDSRKEKGGPAVITDPPELVQAYEAGVTLFSSFRQRDDRYERPAFDAFVEFNVAFGGREDRVIFAHADILAWPPFGAPLTNNDIARNDAFTPEFLDA